MVFILLEQELQFLHKEAADDLVLALLEDVEAIEADLLCHLTNDVSVDAGHVDLDS